MIGAFVIQKQTQAADVRLGISVLAWQPAESVCLRAKSYCSA